MLDSTLKTKILPREIKEGLNREICHVNGLEDSILLKPSLFSTYRFGEITTKTPADF